MTTAQMAEVDMADSSRIAPKATVELLSRQAGGRESLGFIPDNYRNYLRSKRTRKMKVGDTAGILEYLHQMQLRDPNYFYAIQVDEDDLITNIFWVDGRMMVDYDYFGDVVCFDTTYIKNKEGRPFAMFVGVNNYKQTIVFGAALLYDETAKTFMWLFDTFVKAMSGKKPKTILVANDWLKRLYNIKEKWALVYGRENFCADITTTRRSESMNSSLKKYVSYKYDLLRFFIIFRDWLKIVVMKSFPALPFPVEVLKHAATVYTPKVFKMLENELCKAHDCALSFNGQNGTINSYEITLCRVGRYGNIVFHLTQQVMKSYAVILCAHALKVLSTANVKSIPAQYILKRWKKNVKAKSATITYSESVHNPKTEIVRRYRELCRLNTQIATRASEKDKAYEIAIVGLNRTLEAVNACLKENSNEEPSQVILPANDRKSELSEYISVDDDIIRVRGIKTKVRVCGSSKRPKNALEKLTKKKRSRKTELHHSQGVPTPPVIEQVL